jgi:hypothetical protein
MESTGTKIRVAANPRKVMRRTRLILTSDKDYAATPVALKEKKEALAPLIC